ncbi:MAG: nicotinate phosphoribosyltransferase [Motilibacteraceae bacterium]
MTPAVTAPAPACFPVSLLTDRYELTMLSAFVEEGTARRRAVFEAFSRRLPEGRRYGVVAGLGRLLDLLRGFRFDPDEIDWLLADGVVTAGTADYLRGFRLTLDVDAYREGELYFPGSPVLTVRGELGQALILETLLLSVLNFDTAVASAAARMVVAAEGRPLIEMGSRRAHEEAAVAAARAAYLAGFGSTSNLAAGRAYGIPTVGTAAHAFTLAHADERGAFAAQVAAHGPGTTLLVDTFDIERGIRTAVEVAGPQLGAVRIDSGDLSVESRRARALLDSLGATGTKVVVTSDLDEYVIAALADAPIDTFGVGTRVVTGSGAPTAGMVYKLVAIADSDDPGAPLRPVVKKSAGKASAGGRKVATRLLDDGVAVAERLALRGDGPQDGAPPGRPLQVAAVRGGEVVHAPSLAEVRDFHARVRAELPPAALEVADGDPALVASFAESPRSTGGTR